MADKFNIHAIAQNVKVTNNMSRWFEVISHVPQEALINFTELSVWHKGKVTSWQGEIWKHTPAHVHFPRKPDTKWSRFLGKYIYKIVDAKIFISQCQNYT